MQQNFDMPIIDYLPTRNANGLPLLMSTLDMDNEILAILKNLFLYVYSKMYLTGKIYFNRNCWIIVTKT